MEQRKEKLKPKKAAESSDQLSVVLLKNAFHKRQSKNPNYSLRAFAKSLGVSHTVLSLIFSGKRRLSPKLVTKVVEKLDLTFRQRKLFLAEHSHSMNAEEIAKEDFNKIDEDKFSMIAEWQHYAILSLLETKNFKMDYSWISKRLGISVLLVRTTVERLFRLKLIAKNDYGKWHQVGGDIRVDNSRTTSARKKFHQQLIKKAYDSLSNDPFEIRNHSSITFAMSPNDIPYAMTKLREFRLKLAKELEDMGTKEEVYNLCLQIYPVTRKQS